MTTFATPYGDPIDSESIRAGLTTTVMGCRVDYLPSTRSTMDDARRAAAEGAPDGTLIVADEQSAGRGRFQRIWVSPPGVNLYLSLLLRPSPEVASQLSMMAPLALARALRRVAAGRGGAVTIKWPNDVRMGGRKIGGILIESSLGQDGAEGFSIVGIGVNVNFDPADHPEIRDIATGLLGELGRHVPRVELLSALMEETEELYLALGQGISVREEWALLLDTLGQRVRVTWGDTVYEGIAEGVDDGGGLLLRLADGGIVSLSAGEVTLSG